MTENNNNSGDLSKGEITKEQKFLGEILLKEAQQKASFRSYSFYGAWLLVFLFYGSVICFSWKIINYPNIFLPSNAIQTVDQNNPQENTEAKEIPTAKSTTQAINSAQHPVEAENKKNHPGSLINQFLIMIGLLSAVGTTLAIAVMRFSFFNDKDADKENNATLISPTVSSLVDSIKQLADLLKTK